MKGLTLSLIVFALGMGGCQGAGSSEASRLDGAVFGDGTKDPSPVIATVDGYDITQHMLDMRYEELDKDLKARYAGDDGKRLFLREMVASYLRVREAEKRRLQDDPTVARVLISQRRNAMDLALVNDVVKGKEPGIEEIRAYFLGHRDKYQRLGSMHAAHIECATKEKADKAYAEAKADKRPFPYIVHDYSIDEKTRDKDGDLGWFNEDGFIPGIPNSKAFTKAIWNFEVGVNPPIKFDDHWHVVKVFERQYGRPQTLDEAYDRVLADMKPDFQQTLIDAWNDDARKNADLEYFGDYRPGKGQTPQEIFARAQAAADASQKLELWAMLVDDYPQSDRADDSLFLAANLVLDTWGDQLRATRLLRRLVTDYPDSEFASDAQYIIDNMSRPNFVKPKSVEDLRSAN